jgi:AAA+ ATPase superfamily predicted ATPase
MFLGRDRELSVLDELANSGKPELFVLYGRRRVGKTELLQQFCRTRRAVYFLAAQVREKDNLRAFREALTDGIDDPLAANIEFPDWGAALNFAAERAKDERLVVVLDEFPYLCETSKGLTSQVQRFWDTRGKHSKLMLVLCGSQVSFMEREVLAERSPLFGRRTGQRRLEPLAPADTLPFFPRWSMHDRVLAYAMLGGMPAYLRRFDDARPLLENVMRECLRPEGYLFDEVQFLLRSELSNPATYNSILAAIARGNTKVGDIALDVGVDSTTANKYLTTLRELSLVEREVPLTDPDPLRSRRGTYRFADRFLAFHFAHVQPHAGLVQAGRGTRVLEQFVQPDLERLYDEARVDFALAHLRSEAADIVGDEIVETGRFDGRFIRAVARTSDGRGVAAIVVPAEFATERAQSAASKRGHSMSTAAFEAELALLQPAFGRDVVKLVYALTDKPARPLEVERVPEGRIL